MKNESVGGRARQFKIDGFDMGPSWYWMPDVLIVLLADFGKKLLIIELIKLSPAYRVYFGVEEFIAIADNLPEKLRLKKLKKKQWVTCFYEGGAKL
jgi:phytoene desaturase